MAKPSLAILLAVSIVAHPCWADELVLRSGARLLGGFEPAPPNGLRSFRSGRGIRFSVLESDVAEAKRESSAAVVYRDLAPSIADTVAAQWSMAEWCRQRGLVDGRSVHLERVVHLQPNHSEARRALGFSQIDGEWVTRKQVLVDKGYSHYQGRWRLRQEIDLLKDRRRRQEVHRGWIADLQRWRALLDSPDFAAGTNSILAVRDPAAIPALAELLAQEPHRRVKLLYLEVLGQIDDPFAVEALAQRLLNDLDEEVFLASVDQLVHRSSPKLVRHFIEVLKSSRNSEVNRAGYLLGRLGDRQALPALIESLVTVHYTQPPQAGQTTYSFARAAPGGGSSLPLGVAAASAGQPFQFGTAMLTRLPSVLAHRVANQCVLDALTELSGGVSFGYDQTAWRHWYLAAVRN